MNDTSAYTINIRRGEFDGESSYQASVKELPDVVEYADSPEEAYQLAQDAIETTATIMAEKHLPMPPPEQPEEHYSGRVTLRLPRTLHRSLAHKAENEGVSLNQLLVAVLAAFRGFDVALLQDRRKWKTLVENADAVRRDTDNLII